MDPIRYDAVVLVTPDRFERLYNQYKYYLKYMPVRNIYVLGSDRVGELFAAKAGEIASAEDESRLRFICEDDILPFDKVHETVRSEMEPILQGRELPRGITGWYYQQFLKLTYAYSCKDEYYLIWDGDTFPCCNFSMFSGASDENATAIPYFDVKRENHAEYFETMGQLIPGLEKVIGPSFISEHMLFKKEYVLELINTIEANNDIPGEVFWEKIIHCVGNDRIQKSAFSEYETYGTYMAIKHPSAYRLREWHSFRLGGEFFDPSTISDSDYEWLGKDFTAISFEKNQTVREDHKNLFDNPVYQQKLSAKQMLQIAQEEFEDGYKESWGDEEANTTSGEFGKTEYTPQRCEPGKDRLKYLSDETWLEYAKLGESLLDINLDQAYLCFENAAFLCPDEDTEKRNELNEMCQELRESGAISVRKTCFIILSYNNRYLMEECLESIYTNCAPGSFSVVILDNASNDGVADWLKSRTDDDLTLLLSDENLGFAKGCNEAVKYADPDSDILYLNNDTRVPANALFWLRMGLYSSDDIGATGALQNYSSNQLLDVSFDFPEQYMEFGAGHNVAVDDPYKEMSKLSGFAMLVRRNVIDITGGFDEAFSPGYFEDDDLCHRIRQGGYRLIQCNNSFIYHVGSQGFVSNPEAEAIFNRNRQRFIDKWGYDSYEEGEADPLVTIQLSCYNHEKYVRDTIDSIMHGSYQNFELFITDDGSTDSSRDVIRQAYMDYDQDPRMHLLLREENTSFGVIDEALNLYSGKYICTLGGDDVYFEDKIRKQVEFLEKNGDRYQACFTYIKAMRTEDREKAEYIESVFNQKLDVTGHGLCLLLLTGDNFLNAPSMMMRTDIYRELGGYDYNYRQLQDYDLWMRFLQKYDLQILDEQLTGYGIVPDSLSTSGNISSSIRSNTEEEQIKYEIIRDMPDEIFDKFFPGNHETDHKSEDVMCRKMALLLSSDKLYIRQLAIRYYYENRHNNEFIRLLQEQYHFGRKQLFELTCHGVHEALVESNQNENDTIS
ncbi:MAG: glycosyltransferase family 2 protein [Lachnospiraceae bacterium]|nr:glycosyltransferase family 2 protein [Lachnospiraceae bacterium]